jgi:mRNA export factor
VHYVDPNSRNNFAFKCHRKNKTQIFAVNALDFHPRYGTFATAGSDGTCHFWDKDSKQRLKVILLLICNELCDVLYALN